MKRGEIDKACSFLLNGEGSQRKRAGGHEGKREKIKNKKRGRGGGEMEKGGLRE